MKTIKEDYAFYKEKAIPKNAGYVQQKETELAFYAGAQALFYKIIEINDSDADEAVKNYEKIHNEIEKFVKDHLNSDYGKPYNPNDKKSIN